MINCPSEKQLLKFLRGQSTTETLANLETHIDKCSKCAEQLGKLSEFTEGSEWRRRLGDYPVANRSAFAPPTSVDAIGRLDRFDIISKLGEGGMGEVYRAYDTDLKRPVAIKMIRPEFADRPGYRKWFAREARTASRVKSDYVVTIYEVSAGTADTKPPYLVMELVEGESLKDLMRREGPLSAHEAANIAHEIAKGLVSIHRKTLVHRDIKPSNVLLDETTARARIADFGLARPSVGEEDQSTVAQPARGTPAYMSPEQFSSPESIDGLSDQYSLGVVLYEMLTGQRPFRSDGAELIRQVTTERPPSPRTIAPKIPRDLETICLVCLEIEKQDRFADAGSLADDLQRFLDHEPIRKKRPSVSRRLLLFSLRNRSLVRMAIVFLSVVMLGCVGAIIALSIERGRTDEANGVAKAKSEIATQRTQEAAFRKDRELNTRYLMQVKDAFKAWEANNFDEARMILDLQIPSGKGQTDHRGVEWHYLNYVLGASKRELLFPFLIAVRFNHDGTRLAALGTDDEKNYCVRLWKFPSLELERTFELSPPAIVGNLSISGRLRVTTPENIAFNQDGTLLAVSYRFRKDDKTTGMVHVWECNTGHRIRTVADDGIFGAAVIFSPDGRYLIAGGYRNSALVWELGSGELRWTLLGYAEDRSFRIERQILRAGTDSPAGYEGVTQLLFSQGGDYLERNSHSDKGFARTPWPPADPPGYGLQGNDAIIGYNSPQGAWGVSNKLKLVHLSAWKDGRPEPNAKSLLPPLDLAASLPLKIAQDQINMVAIGRDQVAIADHRGRVSAGRFDTDTGKLVARAVPKGHKGFVDGLVLSPGGGEYLVAFNQMGMTVWRNIYVPTGNGLFDRALYVRPEARSVQPYRLRVHGRWQYRVIAANGLTPNAVIEIYDRYLPQNRPRYLAIPYADSSVFVISSDGSRLAVTDRRPPSKNQAVIPEGVKIPASGNTICVFDVISGKILHLLTTSDELTTDLSFDKKGETMMSVSPVGQMRIWDVKTGKCRTFIDAKDYDCRQVERSADGRWIGGVSPDGSILVWDVAKGEVIGRFEGVDGQFSWAFHENLFAVPIKGKQLKVWDLVKRQFRREMHNLGRNIDDLAFLNDGKRLVSVAEGKMTLWTLETEAEICTIPAPYYIKGQWSRIVEVLERLGKTSKQ